MLSPLAKYLLVIGVLGGMVWLGWLKVKEHGAAWLPVRYVRIEGTFQYISKQEIRQVVFEHLKGGLYNVDIQQVKQSVKNLPWVEKVAVKRVWPDAIVIRIREQSAVARWGESALLNDQGDVFFPNNVKQFSYLPLLTGPTGSEKKLLEVMKGLMLGLRDKGMQLLEFKVNRRLAWTIGLKNGLQMKLGKQAPLNKFHRFLTGFRLIGQEQMTKVARVDLRYPNGFALTWKQGVEKIDWKKQQR